MATRQVKKARNSRVTVDLLAYKQPWLDWCQAQGVTPSDALRRVVARLVAAKRKVEVTDQAPAAILRGERERPIARKEISLTASELARVQALAAAEGFSATKWIVALIGQDLRGQPNMVSASWNFLPSRTSNCLRSVAT